MEEQVRLGIIGAGIMGTGHATNLTAGKVPAMRLAALCDNNPEALGRAMQSFPGIPGFADADELIASGTCDAILIATPHYFHPPIAIKAMEAGLHACSEKPIAVYTLAAREMIAAAQKTGKVFAVMFNERTNPYYAKVKKLLEDGELGQITRIHWTATHWYRTQYYYDMGDWRGSWAGEGGGVLMNQCPHQLDLLQWMFGMPETVLAECRVGRTHHIEVEDDVTAFLTYKNGVTCIMTTNTGESPGTNRLEVAGTRGRLVVEEDSIRFTRLCQDIPDHLANARAAFEQPERWEISVPITGEYTAHCGVLSAFADKILGKGELIAEGAEGISGLMLCNAMYLSSWTGKTISLPIDDEQYWTLLQEKIAASGYKRH